jgi:hypothetical protein
VSYAASFFSIVATVIDFERSTYLKRQTFYTAAAMSLHGNGVRDNSKPFMNSVTPITVEENARN